jgi:hypothetical protein
MSTINGSNQTIQILRKTYSCGLSNKSERMIIILNDLDGISMQEKHRLINRFIELSESYTRRALFYALVFHIGRVMVTVGSLIVPALLSVQYTNSSESGSMQPVSYQIYWTTWILSLLVTTCNGILTLFKIDKKYYFLHTTLEQLHSETWQFIYLTGKYNGYYTKGRIPTHSNQVVFFSHNMEKIKLKQVEEEYFKLTEPANHDKHSYADSIPDTKMLAGLYSPTPQTNDLLVHQEGLAQPPFSTLRVDGLPNTEATRGETSPTSQSTVPV